MDRLRFDMDRLNDIDLDKLSEPKHINAFYIWFDELNFPFHGVPIIEIIEDYILWLREQDFTRYHILEFLREIKKDYNNITVSLMNIDSKFFLRDLKNFKRSRPEQGIRAYWIVSSLTNHHHTRAILIKTMGWLDNTKSFPSELEPIHLKQDIRFIVKLIKELNEYLDNEIECYKEVEEEITFKTNKAILKSNKSHSNNMEVISRKFEDNIKSIILKREATEFVNGVIETEVLDLNDKPRINLKEKVIEFAKGILDNKLININNKYFVRDAMKKLIPELNKRPGVELSAGNRKSIRTYLSKFKSNFIQVQEKKKGKRKKK